MSVQVLIPTQRIHPALPPRQQENAHASSSRLGRVSSTNATASSSSSSSSSHPHPHPDQHHHHHDDDGEDDSGSDVELVIEVDDPPRSAGRNKGKGRSSLASPSSPSHSSSNRKFACTFSPTECTKSFTKKARLEEHILTHTGEVSLPLPFFRRREELRQLSSSPLLPSLFIFLFFDAYVAASPLLPALLPLLHPPHSPPSSHPNPSPRI